MALSRKRFIIADIDRNVSKFSKVEIDVRNKLACLYHLFDRNSEWTEGIYTHTSARLSEDKFLLNPFGTNFFEISASNLVTVNLNGQVLDRGSLDKGVNDAGFNLHSSIYRSRPDVRCIIHLHPIDVVAVSLMKCGLLPMTQDALSLGPISYHVYKGLVNDEAEQGSFLEDLLPDSRVMILRNHGILVIGPSIEEAFYYLYFAVKACTIQVRALQAVGLENLIMPCQKVQENYYKESIKGAEHLNRGQTQDRAKTTFGQLDWDAWMSLLEHEKLNKILKPTIDHKKNQEQEEVAAAREFFSRFEEATGIPIYGMWATQSAKHTSTTAFMIFDPWEKPYYASLLLTSVAVLYNMFLLTARITFTELESERVDSMAIWYCLDYVSDCIYILDMAVQSRKAVPNIAGRYLQCVYWVAMTVTTGESLAIDPVENSEFILAAFNVLLGILLFATIVGNIGALVTAEMAKRTAFHNWYDELAKYMKRHRIKHQVVHKIRKWVEHYWLNEHAAGGSDDALNFLPYRLQAEINMNVHLDTLRRVKIFQDCEPGLLVTLVNKLKLVMFNPREFICRVGDVGKEMYIVRSGRLSVLNAQEEVVGTLLAGAVFGELSLLNISGTTTGNRRTATVRSDGYSYMFCLTKEDLWAALQDFPDARRVFIDKGRSILIRDGLLKRTTLTDSFRLLSSHKKLETLDTRIQKIISKMCTMIIGLEHFKRRLKRRISFLERNLAQFDPLFPRTGFGEQTDISEETTSDENLE